MEEKTNFFKKLWISVRDFEKYEQFAADKVSKAIIYILIFTIAISLTYTYKFYTIVEGAKDYINENIEDIKLENGKLEVSTNSEDLTIINEESIVPIIIINTSDDVNVEELKGKNKVI